MTQSVEQLFAGKDDAWWADWLAKWDAMQAAYVPHRVERFRLIAEILADRFPERCRVADIGAGTGTLAQEILNRVPGSSVLCLDVEPFMLAGARKRLEPFGDRARVVRCDFRKEDFTTEITENTEQDGGHRGARPTTLSRRSMSSDVGRAPLCPPKPRSGAPGDETTEGTEPNFEAVVSSTTLHWFGEEILQRIYAWASSMLLQPSPAQRDKTTPHRSLGRAVGPEEPSLGRKPQVDDPGTDHLSPVGATDPSLGRQPQVHDDKTNHLSPVGATETPAGHVAHGGLFLNADHIQPDDPDLAQFALDLNETVRACLFQQTGAPTWDEFWDGLGNELGISSYYDTVARPAWGEQDGPEPGYPFSLHDRLLRQAGFRHIAILWRHLPDALLLATR